MSQEVLQNIVGMAVIDRGFRRLLLENPESAVDRFDLTPEELEVVTAIEADSIEEFAQELHEWLVSRNGQVKEEVALKEAMVVAVGASQPAQEPASVPV